MEPVQNLLHQIGPFLLVAAVAVTVHYALELSSLHLSPLSWRLNYLVAESDRVKSIERFRLLKKIKFNQICFKNISSLKEAGWIQRRGLIFD